MVRRTAWIRIKRTFLKELQFFQLMPVRPPFYAPFLKARLPRQGSDVRLNPNQSHAGSTHQLAQGLAELRCQLVWGSGDNHYRCPWPDPSLEPIQNLLSRLYAEILQE